MDIRTHDVSHRPHEDAAPGAEVEPQLVSCCLPALCGRAGHPPQAFAFPPAEEREGFFAGETGLPAHAERHEQRRERVPSVFEALTAGPQRWHEDE